MSSISENSTVLLSKYFCAEEPSTKGGGWESMDAEGKTRFKILAIDEANKSFDSLLWLASDTGFGTGRHTHGGESYVYIVEGGYALTVYADHNDKEGTTTHYSKGDFLYQPAGQLHEEFLGDEDTLLYISTRHSDTTFEAFDDAGNVVMTESLVDVKEMLKI